MSELQVQFDNPGVRARVTAMRAEALAAGIPEGEFDEALALANTVDGDRDLFTDVDLGHLEQAVQDTQMSLQRPSFVPRGSVADKIGENLETRRRDAVAAQQAGNGVSPELARTAVPAQRLTTPPPEATEHRLLSTNGVTSTRYWGRVSPDGTLFAMGTNRGVSVFDIRPGQNNAVHFKQGSFDPTFTGTDLVFQGGGTWRVSQDWLRNNPPEEVTGEVPGFVQKIESMALYQDVAARGNADIALDGQLWVGDSGPSSRDPRVTASKIGVARLHFHDGRMGAARNTQTVSIPFHTGTQLSNDGQHLVSQIVNPDMPSQQVGYAIHRINRAENGEVSLEPVRVVAGLQGGKPKMAGDYVVYHHAATVADYAMYGFASADDPAFVELVRRGTADIHVYNMRDNTVRRITNAGPGNLAWFPSLSQDAQGNTRVVYIQQNADGSRRIMSAPVTP